MVLRTRNSEIEPLNRWPSLPPRNGTKASFTTTEAQRVLSTNIVTPVLAASSLRKEKAIKIGSLTDIISSYSRSLYKCESRWSHQSELWCRCSEFGCIAPCSIRRECRGSLRWSAASLQGNTSSEFERFEGQPNTLLPQNWNHLGLCLVMEDYKVVSNASAVCELPLTAL